LGLWDSRGAADSGFLALLGMTVLAVLRFVSVYPRKYRDPSLGVARFASDSAASG
jgi:hypothetical protein